jgi:hypothetical protein
MSGLGQITSGGKNMKNLIAVVLVLTLAGQWLWAKAPDQKHVEKIKNQAAKYLDSGNHVSVETYDSRQFGGTITEANLEGFVLTNAAGSTTLSYGDVKKIKSPTSPRMKRAIVTAAFLAGLFGLVFGALANDK